MTYIATYYGNTDGTSNSSFRIACEYSATNQGNGYYQYRYRFYLQVTKGNFYGTSVDVSWSGSNVTINGSGKYGYSAYSTKNVAYGSNFTLGSTAYAQYTGSQTYRSSISGSTKIATAPRPTYTVKYNANGGSGAPSSQTKKYGITLKLSSSKPTRTGYSFQGWGTSSSDTSVNYAAGANYTSNANITLYAIWKANTYTVKYNANGGSGAPSSQTKTYGATLTLSSTKPTRTNYNFLGWGTSASSTTVSYSPGSTYTKNAAITLYAIWELAYVAPRISNISIDRCSSSGVFADDGTYARVRFSWACDKDVSSCYVEWKSTQSGSLQRQTINVSGTKGNVDVVVGNNWIDVELTWSFTIYIADSLGNTTEYYTLSSMHYEIDFLGGGGGVAIGKPASNKGFEIAYDTLIEKNLKFTLDSILSANDIEFLKFISSGIPIFSNHFGIENGKYIQGEQSSGSLTNIIGMNTSNQVELNWTTGGLKGRVMKEIWSGTWSSGTLSGLTELPYYNILAIGVCFSATDSSENAMILGFRVGQTFVCFGAVRSGTDTRLISGMFQTTTGTNLLYYNGLSMITMSSSISSSLSNRKIYAIYGLL